MNNEAMRPHSLRQRPLLGLNIPGYDDGYTDLYRQETAAQALKKNSK